LGRVAFEPAFSHRFEGQRKPFGEGGTEEVTAALQEMQQYNEGFHYRKCVLKHKGVRELN